MWSLPLISATMALAAPAPDAFIEVGCPWTPLYFEGDTAEIDASGHDRAIGSWFEMMVASPIAGEARVVLRAYTTGPASAELSQLSTARAEAARSALIARGMHPDRIMIGAHAFDGGPSMASEGWSGGWIFPEFFITRAAADRMFPPGGPIC
ncbi:MAG: hypothetical protein QOI38_259 [Sphingomonadales bacterium]|jgi:hypothetical protein|nr:hypothetical protein [Sphingomonadales bacterium]